MKLLSAILALVGLVIIGLNEPPMPIPYEPTGNPAGRVQEFIRGDRDTIDESDLFSPSVSPSLRKAAQLLID